MYHYCFERFHVSKQQKNISVFVHLHMRTSKLTLYCGRDVQYVALYKFILFTFWVRFFSINSLERSGVGRENSHPLGKINYCLCQKLAHYLNWREFT